MIFVTRKVESLGMVKKIAEKFNRLSRVHQRHTRQTDNRQTDGIAMASEREREFTSAKKLSKSAFSEGVRHFERQFQVDGDVARNRPMDRRIGE